MKNPSFMYDVQWIIPSILVLPLVSTLMKPSSTSLLSSTLDVSYMNQASRSHGIDTRFTSQSSTTSSSSSSVDFSAPIFHSNEEILESLTTQDYPWDDLQHHSYFLPYPTCPSNQYTIESKYFFLHGKVNWFKNLIPMPEAFEDMNLTYISPNIEVDISIMPGVEEHIPLGGNYSPEEVTAHKALF